MDRFSLLLLHLLLFLLFPLSFANFLFQIAWLQRTYACQAQYYAELQTALASNQKAQVLAPKGIIDNDCSSLICVLKFSHKITQQLPPRVPPFPVPNFIPCNTKANSAATRQGKLGPGQMCYTDDNGNTACRTVAEIGNILNPQNNGGRYWGKVVSKNEPIEIDFDYDVMKNGGDHQMVAATTAISNQTKLGHL